jgi:hypothetical protein
MTPLPSARAYGIVSAVQSRFAETRGRPGALIFDRERNNCVVRKVREENIPKTSPGLLTQFTLLSQFLG